MDDLILEAKFIAQEHRTIKVWGNWLDRKKFSNKDPRKKATYDALISWWLSKIMTLALSGGFIALLSLYFMAQQTKLMEKQNGLLLEQINEQRTVNTLARKTELIRSIYGSESKKEEVSLSSKAVPNQPPRVRSEALAEYLQIRRMEIKSALEKYSKTQDVPVAATLNFGIDLRWAPLQGIDVDQLDMHHISLYHSNFEFAKLNFVDFSKSQLEYVRFFKSELMGVKFNDASLIGADLREANVSSIEWNENTKVWNANIYGIENPPKGFREWALRKGAVEFADSSMWMEHVLKSVPALANYIEAH
ncbi:MAG: pentapeptide repeat-containing protein [Cyclobacteriaceae bacterium]|nr:pentapeptide repeat-containing protein [Cyclobacteriaceae bacterium]